MKTGHFVISLDFEIYWGVRDITSIDGYKNNLLGVRKAIPSMLEMFSKYRVTTTFATVGFLFFKNKSELSNGLPSQIPAYTNKILSPYEGHLNGVGEDENNDPFHYGYSLIEQIQKHDQEIGCHTFSHYYCLEEGQTIDDFKADLAAAKNIALKRGITLKSFVFPRNQYNQAYLKVCSDEGITSFRGNEKSKLFSAKNYGGFTSYRRPFRLLDAYLNLSGHNCYNENQMKNSVPVNIPASRFLRPYSKKLAMLDGLQLKRITNSMTYAAKNMLAYHIWWHPHNFGINTEKNILFLEKILIHFQKLNTEFGFQSSSMTQLADILSKKDEG